MRFKKEFLLGVALGLIACNVAADTLYDSLSSASSVSAGYNLISDANFGPLANSFSTGSNNFFLNDLQLALAVDNPTTGGTVTISLLSDSGSSPGATLATLGVVNDSALSAYTPTTVDFPLSTAIDLAANTRYWIEVSATNDSSAGWSYTADTTGIGVAGEFNANSFQVYSNSGDPGLALINNPYQLQINGATAVPLPGAAWLFVTVVGCFSALRQRQKAFNFNQA